MVRSLGSSMMLMALASAVQGQSTAPAPTASGAGAAATTLTPMERAQRDADKVFYWVKLHGNTPAKPAPVKDGAASSGPRPANAAATAATAPATVAAAAVKRPALAGRNTDAPPATPTTPAASAAPADRAAPEPAEADSKSAPAAPAEPSSPAEPLAVAEPTGMRPEPKEPPLADRPTIAAAPTTEHNDTPRETNATPALEAALRTDTPAPPDPTQSERLRPITQAAPEFPPLLVQSLRRGSVRVQFNVMPDGTVAALDVLSSSNTRLNMAALAAVAQWRFQPVARAQLAQVDLAFSID